MSALAAAVHQASLQHTVLLETLDAVQVGVMAYLHVSLSYNSSLLSPPLLALSLSSYAKAV